jgi:hypothetical protein
MKKIKRVKKTYKQLAKVGEEVYGDKGFCGVVAIAVAGQVSYGKAKALAESDPVAPRTPRKGTPCETIIRSINKLGAEVFEYDVPKGSKTLESFAKNHPEGVWLCLNNGGKHITAIRDGKIMDWADEHGRKKRVCQAWQVAEVVA